MNSLLDSELSRTKRTIQELETKLAEKDERIRQLEADQLKERIHLVSQIEALRSLMYNAGGIMLGWYIFSVYYILS
jgi:hypothetical protein